MKAISTPTVMAPLDTSQMPNAHTTSSPNSVSKETLGENRDQILLMRSFTARLCLLASRKRAVSRSSWANAFTTRTPGMVSASTLVTSDQTRSIFSKPVCSRKRTERIIQTMNGSGTSVISASQGLMEIKKNRRHDQHQDVGSKVEQVQRQKYANAVT